MIILLEGMCSFYTEAMKLWNLAPITESYFFYCLKFILFVFVLTCVRTCVYVHVPWCTCRVQSTACRSRFSPSIVWVPGTEHRSSELGAKCFVSRATSWLLIDIFSSKKKSYQARYKSVFFYVQK